MQVLKADTQVVVRVGPFVAIANGYVPETGIGNTPTNLTGVDEAELLKHDGAATVDITARTWAAIASCDGWYDLTLTTTDTNTEGLLTVVVQDDDVCLPVFMHFMVVNANVYDSLYGTAAADYLQVDVVQVSGDATAADNLETACDGGSYNIGGGGAVAASVSGAVGSVTGAVGSVTGAVGSVTGAVGSVAGNVDGNVTGSTASVAGAVGSVTGAVGSVAGNVDGNVTGSVGSVAGAVGSVTGAVGSVTGSVGSVAGNVDGNVTGSTASVAGAVGSVTGAVGSVTGAVGSVAGNVDGNVSGSTASVAGAVGSVTGAVGSVAGNVDGNVTGSVGSVAGAVGSVTGAVGSVTGAVGSVTAGVTLGADAVDNTALAASALTEIQASANAALVANHLDHLFLLAYTHGSHGNAAALLNEITEDDGGLTRFTENSLEEAPSGTGASAATIATAVMAKAVDGAVDLETALKRILAMTSNTLVITGTDPLTFTFRNSADGADVAAHSVPVATPTGRTASFT